jgi:hypothetical protein
MCPPTEEWSRFHLAERNSWASLNSHGLLSYVFIRLIFTDIIMADLQDDLQDVHTVLEMCGMTLLAIRTLSINLEGLSDFNILADNNDVMAMTARMSRCTVAEGKIILGTTVIKHLQTLIWWIHDQKKQNLPLEAANFNADMLEETAALKQFRSEQATRREPPVTALATFQHPDDFDTHEDAFLNLLAQSFGVIKEPLRYIVHSGTAPTTFVTNEEQRMYRFLLHGPSYELDNQSV